MDLREIEVEGIFDDVEPEVVRWVFALTMATNDLSYGAKKIKNAQDYEQIYMFRLGFAHLREIAKVIGQTKENQNIQIFIQTLNQEAQTTYKRIEQFLGNYDEAGFVKNHLKGPRDETFHYPDINGRSWVGLVEDVKKMKKVSVHFDQADGSIMGTRYRFIDILLSERVNKGLSKEIVDQSSRLVVDLFSFVDYVFEHLVKRQNADQE